jgi:hypothetical protein
MVEKRILGQPVTLHCFSTGDSTMGVRLRRMEVYTQLPNSPKDWGTRGLNKTF